MNAGIDSNPGTTQASRPEELDATQLTHADILNRVCAQLDLSPKELIPFSIRVSNLLAFGNKLQAFVHEVRSRSCPSACVSLDDTVAFLLICTCTCLFTEHKL